MGIHKIVHFQPDNFDIIHNFEIFLLHHAAKNLLCVPDPMLPQNLNKQLMLFDFVAIYSLLSIGCS